MKSHHVLSIRLNAKILMYYLIHLLPIRIINCNHLQTVSAKERSILYGSSSVIFSSNYSGQEVVFRVLNGEPAMIQEIPYQIAIMRKPRYFSESKFWVAVCGGAIIGEKKVLTAAHCIRGSKISDCNIGHRTASDLKNFRIVAGQVNSAALYGSGGQWRKIKRAKYPHRFSFPKHDIAVVHVYEVFVYNDAVQPIPYASKLIDYGGMLCLASGYGRVDAVHRSSILLKAYLTILPMDVCNLVHQEDFSKHVCTSDFIADLHKGDSGGPLVCKDTSDPAEINSTRGIVVGTVSGKAKHKRMSTFFTRVSSYHKFISSSSKTIASPYFLCFNLFISLNILPSQF